MNKFKNFPPVYYISLEDSYERQKSMNLQLDLLGIESKTMVTAYDGKIVDYHHNEIVDGMYFHQMDSGQIAVVMSHLKAIKEWYYHSDTSYAIFLEDDMTFETSQYWNFTWNDIVQNLPKNWKVIQLALIKEDGITENEMKLHKRPWWNWSAGAYMITRDYAKVLIDDYCNGEKYQLKIKNDLRLIPLIENVIYLAAGSDAYTFPLFTEDTSHLSTFYPNLIDDTHKGGQIQSSQFILNWWKTKGCSFLLEQLIEKKDIIKFLNEFIADPQNPEKNYNLAIYYEEIGQTASALSYYLRTAERTKNKVLQYECLLRASICFDKQGSRNFTVKGLLQNSITTLPKRPEAYYLLAKFYSQENKDGSWNDCYLISTIAENIVETENEPLNNSVSYPGFYGILYYKAISSWWCGLCGESKKLFKELLTNYDLTQSEIETCKEYLTK